MALIPASKILDLIAEIFTTEELASNKLFPAGDVPPLSIIRISSQFESLNLAAEDILLVFDNPVGSANRGFVLTNRNIHFYKGYLKHEQLGEMFDENDKLKPPLPGLPNEMREKLATLFKAILEYDPKTDMNVRKYGGGEDGESIPISGLGDAGKDDITPEIALKEDLVDKAFLHLLQHEGEAYTEMCEDLDKDKVFKETIQKMANNTDVIINDPSAKELFAQDMIKIFNICSAADREITRREQFALAYVFERLINEGDMAKSIKLNRINDMITNDQFQKNIKVLQEYKIFNIKSEFPNELLLPVVLSKLDYEEQSTNVATHLHRFASIVLKADGKVTKEEEAILKNVWKMANEPKKAIPNVKQIEADGEESLEEVLAELNELIGLKNIKSDISTLINFLKVQGIRKEKGLATSKRSLHSVFMGPPGTGKTTIARLLSRVYKHLGILSRGHLVETDRAGLVAGYIGQTALKVDEVVKAALDGVLFIDEAYALSRGGDSSKRDFGVEAVEALLKRMEDYRDRLVVIVAGYPDEMEDFIKSNPGLQSRFNRYFNFEHYKGYELLAIFKLFARKADFKLDEEAEEKLSFIFDELYEKRNKSFGNARVARNLLDECIRRQANRIVSIAPLTEEILMSLTEEDIPPIKETVRNILVFDPKKKAAQQTAGIDPEQLKQLQQLSNVINPNAGSGGEPDEGNANDAGSEDTKTEDKK